ncbi:energy transducer TonB [Polyangium spumosum]|uniref:TonB family protein n=1 Tax=Polyangium spumosum TaxID=889282 RepID=A0A6N7Q158_9BACT|nr:energy transducer TonB [Polyangium spumosum]MRG96325.1 TonB family protein [Polyangium spumosum]
MSEMRRLLDEKGDDPATALLASARADRAPAASKARALAALGIEPVRAARAAVVPARALSANTRRATQAAPRALFQSVLGPTGRQAGRFQDIRNGAALAAAVFGVVLLAQPTSGDRTSRGPIDEPRRYAELDLGAQGRSSAAAAPAHDDDAPVLVDTEPKRIGGRDPVYTREALEARVEGAALLECEVTAEGATRDCRLLKSLPHMDGELLAAARTWRFSPATQGGRPVSVRYVSKVHPVPPK